MDDQLALPALALRAADWVPQVRNRARLALEQRLSPPSADVLLTVGPLAVALQERGYGRWLLGQFQDALHAASDDVLAPLLAAPEWLVRRAAYEAALADNRLSLGALVAAAQHDSDLVIRVRCAESAVRAAVATGRADAVQPLTFSKTAAVRAEAVHALARAGQVEAASKALSDRHPAVRAVAQAAVRRAGNDPANSYRQYLQTATPPDPGAIAGLGETGTGQDAGLVRPSLTHPLPRGRAETVRALRRLEAATPDTIGALLEDPSAAVTRQVVAALRPVAAGLDVHRLRTLLDAAQPPHVRLAAYRLLREHDVWTRLRTDLELIKDPHLALRTAARTDLDAWVLQEAATTYSMPQGETAQRLNQLVLAAESVLSADRIRGLRFHMGLGKHSAT
jgi:hypothetical protein